MRPWKTNALLKPFVDEWNKISANPVQINKKKYNLNIKNIITDLQAKAMMFGTKFNGFYGCSHCLIKGVPTHIRKIKRICFPEEEDFEPPLRTDDDYEQQNNDPWKINSNFEKFFQKKSILLNLNKFSGGVTGNPFDFMHCGAGIVLRLLNLLSSHRGNLSREAFRSTKPQLNTIIDFYASCAPIEIKHRMRNFENLNHWKSSEFLLFGSITGLVILRNLHPNEEGFVEVRECFNTLFCILRVISNDEYLKIYRIESLKALVKEWLVVYRKIFGEKNCTLIIHTLKHIIEDVERHGSTYKNFSAFKYESYFCEIKRMFLHNHSKPHITILKRYHEYQ